MMAGRSGDDNIRRKMAKQMTHPINTVSYRVCSAGHTSVCQYMALLASPAAMRRMLLPLATLFCFLPFFPPFALAETRLQQQHCQSPLICKILSA